MYAATTTIIARTGQPLFDIKIPERIRKLYTPPPAPKQEAAPSPTTAPTAEAPTYKVPAHIPPEMHGAYIRTQMRVGIEGLQKTPAPATIPAQATPVPAQAMATAGELPLPTDFDFDFPAPSNAPDDNIPTFSSITFDATPDTENTATTDANNDATAYISDQLTEYLKNNGRPIEIQDQLIISDNLAIACHEDTDFWIADELDWFASGKHRPSPIPQLIDAATNGKTPILYLGSQNILDIEENTKQWQQCGILIITSPDELPQ